MNSFLESNYYLIYKGIEIFAALVGVLLLKKYKNDKAAKYFIFFLVYIQIIETFGDYPNYIHKFESLYWIKDALKNTIFIKNYWWYTIFWTIGSTIFFGFYFYKILKTKKIKHIVKWAVLFCVVLSIILFIINYNVFNYSYLIVLDLINFLLILFLVFSYLTELLNSENILLFFKSLPFYVALGIFVFWLITTPLVFFEEYYNTTDKNFIYLKKSINLFAIIFTYLTFTIGLVVSTPKKNN